MLSLERQLERLPFKSDPSDGRRALSVGGDSFRPAPDGAIRFDNGAGRRESLPASSRADDPDYVNTCQHEASHALAGLGMSWTVTYCDAIRGETKCLPPPGLSEAQLAWQKSVIAAASKGFASGESSDYGFSGDEEIVRSLDEDWGAAVTAARKLAGNPAVRAIHQQIVGALIVNGRLERDELAEIWDA